MLERLNAEIGRLQQSHKLKFWNQITFKSIINTFKDSVLCHQGTYYHESWTEWITPNPQASLCPLFARSIRLIYRQAHQYRWTIQRQRQWIHRD